MLIVILIVALIITNVSKDDKSLEAPEESTNIAEDNSEDESTDAAEDNTEDSAEDNTSFEPEATDSVYNQLCEKYLRSIYVEWDDETLSEICDSTQNLSKDDYSFYNKYIEDIENVNCYIGYETDDGKLLVLVTYNMKFVNISTSAPDMVAVVLVKSDDGEGYLIHNLEVEDEVYFYTSDLQNSQGYIDLCEEIRNQLSEALASDENLQKVYDIIKGMSE